MPKNFPILTLNIEELDERGYGIAQHGNKIVQVLNALPGETVEAQIFRKKKGSWQGVAKQVLQASNLRVAPREDHFLCCSPWQILDFEAENQIKASSIKKFYQEAQVDLPDFDIVSLPDQTWNYRNKAEFSFYSDDTEQLNLAFFGRDSRSKYPHTGCVLMAEPINIAGRRFLDFLNDRKIQARQLKSIILRYCYAQNKVVACLFFKDESLEFNLEELSSLLDEILQGISIIYSTHKSPAPVVTEIRHQLGCMELTESICDVNLTYNWDNFFQINPPVFELAAKDMIEQIKATPDFSNLPVVEMYAGIGTLGLLVAPLVPKVLAVEVTPGSQELAIRNAEQNRVGNFEFIESLAEESVSAIAPNQILILDPPRVGLHNKVIEKIIAESPKHIIYLSCNPKTQAANYAALQEQYKIRWMRAYNFYPHTPHVESLLVLDKR